MGCQFSASRTDLGLQCPRPFDSNVETEDDAGEAANYGSALAELVGGALTGADKKWKYGPRDVAEKWGVKEVDDLEAHAIRAVVFLKKWIAGDNPFKVKFKITRV